MTNTSFIIKTGLCLCLASAASLQAQDAVLGERNPPISGALGKSTNPNAMTDGITGMLINNMVTPNGHQFFQLFGLSWQESGDVEAYSLSLVEVTSRRRGSQVFIYAGNRLLFSGGLPFKSSQLKLVVDQALEAINTRPISDAMEAESADIDLGKEEL